VTREPSAVLHVAFLKSKDVIASRPEAFAAVAPDVGVLLQARVVGGGFDAEDGPSVVLLALDDAVLDRDAEVTSSWHAPRASAAVSVRAATAVVRMVFPPRCSRARVPLHS
jgi:hypothetical protein